MGFHPDPELQHRHVSHLKAKLRCFLSLAFPFVAFPPLVLALLQLEKLSALGSFHFLGHEFLGLPAPAVAVLSFLTCIAVLHYVWFNHRPVYLLDFACYKAPDGRKLAKQDFMHKSELLGKFTEESLDFQKKILQRSGIGQETYFPRAVTNVPPNPCLDEARLETEDVVFGCLDELFAKASGIKPRDIGILVVNCSVFCPSPSMCALIVNKYNLRSNIISYNLGGMGCSAGVIAVGLAQELLKVHHRTRALVISTENITLNWYIGNDKAMLVSNCLFRLGGCAALLSNIPCDRSRANYQLKHIVRTHKAAEDKSYCCVQQADDTKGLTGVQLSRELMNVAGNALKTNITTLGPLVLPVYEQLHFFAVLLGRKILKLSVKPYIPDFKVAFDHFCIHAGGRAVLEEVEKNLMLTERLMEPSRMTLYRFGNTSSSSIWYELAYLEAKGRVKKGDRVWQIGFGSGFKCNSAVWHALRDVHSPNCWSDMIHQFPQDVPAVEKF